MGGMEGDLFEGSFLDGLDGGLNNLLENVEKFVTGNSLEEDLRGEELNKNELLALDSDGPVASELFAMDISGDEGGDWPFHTRLGQKDDRIWLLENIQALRSLHKSIGNPQLLIDRFADWMPAYDNRNMDDIKRNYFTHVVTLLMAHGANAEDVRFNKLNQGLESAGRNLFKAWVNRDQALLKNLDEELQSNPELKHATEALWKTSKSARFFSRKRKIDGDYNPEVSRDFYASFVRKLNVRSELSQLQGPESQSADVKSKEAPQELPQSPSIGIAKQIMKLKSEYFAQDGPADSQSCICDFGLADNVEKVVHWAKYGPEQTNMPKDIKFRFAEPNVRRRVVKRFFEKCMHEIGLVNDQMDPIPDFLNCVPPEHVAMFLKKFTPHAVMEGLRTVFTMDRAHALFYYGLIWAAKTEFNQIQKELSVKLSDGSYLWNDIIEPTGRYGTFKPSIASSTRAFVLYLEHHMKKGDSDDLFYKVWVQLTDLHSPLLPISVLKLIRQAAPQIQNERDRLKVNEIWTDFARKFTEEFQTLTSKEQSQSPSPNKFD